MRRTTTILHFVWGCCCFLLAQGGDKNNGGEDVISFSAFLEVSKRRMNIPGIDNIQCWYTVIIYLTHSLTHTHTHNNNNNNNNNNICTLVTCISTTGLYRRENLGCPGRHYTTPRLDQSTIRRAWRNLSPRGRHSWSSRCDTMDSTTS